MKELKISKDTIIFFLLIFFSLKIVCISYISTSINIIWYMGSIICSAYVLFFLIVNNKTKIFDFAVFLFFGLLLINTIINHGTIYECLRDIITFSSLFFVMRYGLEKNPKQYIKMMSGFLFVYTIINTSTAIILYPNSLFVDNKNPIFFLGGDNTSIRLYIACILFSFLNNYQKTEKMKIPLLSLANLMIFSLVRDLGGGKVCFVIMLVGLLYIIKGFRIPKKTIKTIFLVNAIIFIFVVLLHKVNFFNYIIVNFLHRDLTLTTRTTIWEITIEKISQKPLFGYGMISGMNFQALLPYIIGVNAHNTYLMILFNGGLILFLAFVLVFIITSKSFDNKKHQQFIYAIPLSLFTLMIRAQIEGWDVGWIFLFSQLACFYEYIEENNIKKED